MPLNISIDVDGTLLDENEKPVPQARESLQMLKDAGHCLQLWSGGGADYAYKQAAKHRLTDLFDSYGKKPDVAIDDLPETARALAVVHVDRNNTIDRAVKKVLRVEQNIDAALTLSSSLVDFVKDLQSEKEDFQKQYQPILRNGIPLHPIPFFGVLENAKAITVGLNPSTAEFESWPSFLTACELTKRLVDYFQPSKNTSHYWFAELQWAFETLHCPYHFAAAHVDVTPWTTYAPTTLAKKKDRNLLSLYNQLLDVGVRSHLPRVLKFCNETVKLIIICSSDEPKREEAKRLPTIEHAIRTSLGKGWHGEILIKPKRQVCQWAWEKRERLIHLLGVEEVHC